MGTADIAKIIQVSGACLETYPCRHSVTVRTHNGDAFETMLSGVDIWKMLASGKWPDCAPELKNHFLGYDSC